MADQTDRITNLLILKPNPLALPQTRQLQRKTHNNTWKFIPKPHSHQIGLFRRDQPYSRKANTPWIFPAMPIAPAIYHSPTDPGTLKHYSHVSGWFSCKNNN